jgi:TRAP-type C4-dicarboxylate transport system permease small subunit
VKETLVVKGMKRTLTAVRAIAAVWVVTCFIIMAVSVWLQVGGRYLFNYSISWTGELATIAQIWAVLVGAGLAERRSMHPRIDILLNLFPTNLRRALVVATTALGLWFLAAIVVGTVPMMQMGRFQTTPAMGIPLIIPYLGLVIGPIYFAIELVAMAVTNWPSEDERKTASVENTF